MGVKKPRVSIVNRSFWPHSPLIGEALLQLAERLSKLGCEVSVITQKNINLHKKLNQHSRGGNVKFCPSFSSTTSKTNLFFRLIETISFVLWVFIKLFIERPHTVYVATDPPLIVPFCVMVYCKFKKAKYIYHVQDIHPEATNTVIKINKMVMRFMIFLDCVTLRNAQRIITINEEMERTLNARTGQRLNITKLSNPSAPFPLSKKITRKNNEFCFCGNAGRLQRMPLLLDAIKEYLETGGSIKFSFAGSGIYADHLSRMDYEYKNFTYLGFLNSKDTTTLCRASSWALLPIEDEVTKYAFPSKTSTYMQSGAQIFAICGENTSVGRWVLDNELGVVVPPSKELIIDSLFKIQRNKCNTRRESKTKKYSEEPFSIEVFSGRLAKVVLTEQ